MQSDIKVPIVIGRNRLRGSSEGAMVFDDFGQDNLSAFRAAMREEAEMQGIKSDPEWTSKVVTQMLMLYEDAYKSRQAAKHDTVGFIWDCTLPSGRNIYMGDPRTLAKFSVPATWE
jgi:hypothetical protein